MNQSWAGPGLAEARAQRSGGPREVLGPWGHNHPDNSEDRFGDPLQAAASQSKQGSPLGLRAHALHGETPAHDTETEGLGRETGSAGPLELRAHWAQTKCPDERAASAASVTLGTGAGETF